MFRHIHCKWWKSKIECYSTFLTLWIFIKSICTKKWMDLKESILYWFIYLAIVLKALARLVFPESTCPSIPTLKLSIDIWRTKNELMFVMQIIMFCIYIQRKTTIIELLVFFSWINFRVYVWIYSIIRFVYERSRLSLR